VHSVPRGQRVRGRGIRMWQVLCGHDREWGWRVHKLSERTLFGSKVVSVFPLRERQEQPPWRAEVFCLRARNIPQRRTERGTGGGCGGNCGGKRNKRNKRNTQNEWDCQQDDLGNNRVRRNDQQLCQLYSRSVQCGPGVGVHSVQSRAVSGNDQRHRVQVVPKRNLFGRGRTNR
jgi:hypothetical protein